MYGFKKEQPHKHTMSEYKALLRDKPTQEEFDAYLKVQRYNRIAKVNEAIVEAGYNSIADIKIDTLNEILDDYATDIRDAHEDFLFDLERRYSEYKRIDEEFEMFKEDLDNAFDNIIKSLHG